MPAGTLWCLLSLAQKCNSEVIDNCDRYQRNSSLVGAQVQFITVTIKYKARVIVMTQLMYFNTDEFTVVRDCLTAPAGAVREGARY